MPQGRRSQLASRDRSWDLLAGPTLCHSEAMPRNVTRAALLLLATLAAVVVAACGGSDSALGEEREGDARERQAAPERAGRAPRLRIFFDNAPPSVGDKLELTFDGPLRNNGADKLPSLDWKIALLGPDDPVHEPRRLHRRQLLHQPRRPGLRGRPQAVARAHRAGAQAPSAGPRPVGFDPLAAINGVKGAGTRDGRRRQRRPATRARSTWTR